MTDATQRDDQNRRLQAALSPVLALGPEFLAGRRNADEMAHTMLGAVRDYLEHKKAHEEDPGPAVPARDTQQVESVLAELYACGSGYMADRCGADCVARTMTQVIHEYGHLAPADLT